MFTLLLILILIASVLMIGIVLIQKSKGGGLASNFASSNQIMGVRKTTNVVEKATWGLAIVIIVLCIASVAFLPKSNVVSNSVLKDYKPAPTQTVTNPGFEINETESAPAETTETTQE